MRETYEYSHGNYPGIPVYKLALSIHIGVETPQLRHTDREPLLSIGRISHIVLSTL